MVRCLGSGTAPCEIRGVSKHARETLAVGVNGPSVPAVSRLSTGGGWVSISRPCLGAETNPLEPWPFKVMTASRVLEQAPHASQVASA